MNTLKDRLHEVAGSAPDSAPPIARLLERGRRARRQRRATTVVMSALIVVGVVGVAALSPWDGQQPLTGPPSADAQADPRLELAAALSNTEGTSFRVRATNAKQIGDKRGSYVTEGAFDPATATGYTRHADGRFEVRLINGDKYVSKGGESRFLLLPGKWETIGFDTPVLDGELAGSADSERLFEVLREADAKISKTGDNSYRFEFASNGLTVTGAVVLDGQRRVARIEYDYLRQDPGMKGMALSVKGLLEFSGYGLPVRVERPTELFNG